MNKRPSFFKQAGVLISRYFHIFVNNKQNLLMMIIIPLLTTLIVSYVATPDMFATKADEDHQINNSYPVLNWETVVQEVNKTSDEKKNDDDDDEDYKIIGDEEVDCDKWNGNTEAPVTATKMGDENYFVITTAEQLAFLSTAADNEQTKDYLTYNYLLQTDVDLANRVFTPIGTKENPFTGTFDGNGYEIKNLKVDTKNHAGLFGYLKSNETAKSTVTMNDKELTFYHNGIIKNLRIVDSTIKASGNNVGAIVGTMDKTSRVFSVAVKDTTINAKGKNVGGLVGAVLGDTADVYSSYVKDIKIDGTGDNVGGLVGDLGESRLSACYAVAEIDEDGDAHGAVVGTAKDEDDQLKNVFYDNEECKDLEGVDDKDYKDCGVIGKSTKDMKKCMEFLIPFKDIYTAYELEYDKDIKDEIKDDDYDAEKDGDAFYGFKKDGQTAQFYGTQVGIFMLVIVAIFVGVCNSIGEICKERNILKREYMTNLRLDAYVASKLVVQGVVCAIQMVIVLAVFAIFIYAKGKDLPSSGVIFGSIWIEYYITMFLLTFAADVMSLVISAIVKSASGANSLIPIVLIVQIVFCGVMFPLEGIIEILSNVMISKWGICALAATTRLNDTLNQFLIENPSTQLSMGSGMSVIDSLYSSTAAHLLIVWGVLLAFIIVLSVVCRVVLISVKNDKR